MKKSYFILIFIALSFSCQKEKGEVAETTNENVRSVSVSEAKRNYLNTSLKSTGQLRLSTSSEDLPGTPVLLDWRHAVIDSNLYHHYVEVPTNTSKIGAVYQYTDSVYGPDQIRQIIKHTRNFMVFFKTVNGQVEKRMITYVPSHEYLTANKGTIASMTTKELNRNFSGHIDIKNWRGNKLYTLRMENGVSTSRLEYTPESYSKKMDSRSSVANVTCREMYIQVFELICINHYPNDGSGDEVEICNVPQLMYEETTWVCEGDVSDECTDARNYYNGYCYQGEWELIPPPIIYPPTSPNVPNENGDYILPEIFNNFMADFYGQMTEAEKLIFDRLTADQQYLYYINAYTAISKAAQKHDGANNGKEDAYRHGLFSALNTQDFGFDLAKQLGDAHEQDPNQWSLAKEMDLWNNYVGRLHYQEIEADAAEHERYPNVNDIVRHIDKFFTSYKYIKDGQLVKTNQ